MECGDEQEGFFIGLIEDGDPLEGFGGIEGSEFVELFRFQFSDGLTWPMPLVGAYGFNVVENDQSAASSASFGGIRNLSAP